MDSRDLRGLYEAYGEIYNDGFDSWVNSLVEEGYDLSEFTEEELYEDYIEEASGRELDAQGRANMAARRAADVSGARRALQSGKSLNVGGVFGGSTVRMDSGATRAQGRTVLNTTNRGPLRGAADPTITLGGRKFDRLTTRDNVRYVERKPSKPAAKVEPSKTKPSGSPPPKPAARPILQPSGGGTAKTAPAKPAAPAPGTKAAGPESIKPKTPNPLLRDNKISDMIAASKARQAGQNTTSTQIASNRASSLQTASSNLSGSGGLAKTAPKKVAEDIASAYASIYEAKKKVDQDQDGDTDFADVRIARMIASGMSRAEAIAAVKNKPYNEEVEIDEATRMRKELSKEGETATRKELAARSRAHQRSGSVDKTIAAAERAADWSRDEKKARTLRKLASSRRGSVRDNPRAGMRGYAAKVEGPDKELQTARQRAMSAGTLTPKEKKQLGEEFEIWIDALLDEGYDLSDYTWDEMIEIYEETLQQKKEREERQNERRARVAELQAQGRVMTSSKRASQKAKQRKEAQREEELEKRGENVLRQITGTSGKVSEKPMGSEEPKEKEAAPEATRKLHKGLRRDNLGTAADKVLRQVKNEDFEFWVNELLDEGYDIEDWTEEELYDLYEEILDEKYGTAAGRKRVVKMARAGKDIGKKGPGFENMVKKLTPKYGKERATKIAAAQMFKTHA